MLAKNLLFAILAATATIAAPVGRASSGRCRVRPQAGSNGPEGHNLLAQAPSFSLPVPVPSASASASASASEWDAPTETIQPIGTISTSLWEEPSSTAEPEPEHTPEPTTTWEPEPEPTSTWEPEPEPTPEPETPPPPPPPPAQGSGERYSGKATYYNLCDPSQNEGWGCGTVACSADKYQDTDFVVAINAAQYDSQNPCNKNVVITNPSTGATVTAKVVDRCGYGCNWGDIDLSPAVFQALAHVDQNAMQRMGVFNLNWQYE